MTKPASLKTFLWFQSDLEAALYFYKETFKDVEIFEENRMGEGAPLFTADFSIYDHQFIGMSIEGGPVFNTAISLSIQCDGQEETDRRSGGRYWDRTSDPHNVNVVLYR